MELDARLEALRGRGREFAEAIRPYGLDLDRDPSLIHKDLGVPMLRELMTLHAPPAYRPAPLVVGKHRFDFETTVEKVVFFTEAARGDAGFVLSAPGASLSGPIVAALGDDHQQEWFFGRLAAAPTWTFFALTEPRGGSDASGMTTRLTADTERGGHVLNGVKRYIGNGARAQIGVTFAMRGRGPLSASAVLIDAADPGFHAVPLSTIGLRGAQLSQLTFDSVHVAPERLLGAHLPATRGGLWGWLRVFNLFRPLVAGLGLGVARAAYDYVVEHRKELSPARRDGLRWARQEIDSVGRLTLSAAAAVDQDPSRGHLGSAAKVRAAALAERMALYAAGCFGPGGLLDHPYLEKLVRDSRAIEFMEGTSNVQRMNIISATQRR
ncbi:MULTISPECIES: acyl-CoA dehydrogenase family protein [unclassified Streptomyces]|uniref:acyl-CoA dehydrogenase family protein n=1 Tax=unclassified Streptomyces TaxID=2593676 RepID=UPI0036E9335B